MEDKPESTNRNGNWIGAGTATGAVLFVLTRDPVWIGVGVAIGAALEWRSPQKAKLSDLALSPMSDLMQA